MLMVQQLQLTEPTQLPNGMWEQQLRISALNQPPLILQMHSWTASVFLPAATKTLPLAVELDADEFEVIDPGTGRGSSPGEEPSSSDGSVSG